MPTTSTRRVGGAPSGGSSKRVATQGASGATDDTPSSVGTDSWGNSWGFVSPTQPGKGWGRTWHFGTLSVPGEGASGAKPEGTPTPRISGAPSGTTTKRVTL